MDSNHGPAGIRNSNSVPAQDCPEGGLSSGRQQPSNALTEQLVALIDGFWMVMFLAQVQWTNPMIKKDIAIGNGIPTEKIRSLISAHTQASTHGLLHWQKILWLWYLGTNVWADWQPDQTTVPWPSSFCWSEFFIFSFVGIWERKGGKLLSQPISAWTVGELLQAHGLISAKLHVN